MHVFSPFFFWGGGSYYKLSNTTQPFTLLRGSNCRYPQLYKLAAAYKSLVLPREKENGRPFDWLVRCRWDLAWLRPPPPLVALRTDAISLPYSFWPFSDQVAFLPRHLAETYFKSIDSFYVCPEGNQKRWYLPHQVGTEIVLATHLLDKRVPLTLVEVNAPIARSRSPSAWCAIRQTLQLPCLVLAALGYADWDASMCARPIGDWSQLLKQKVETTGAEASRGVGPWALMQQQCENDFRSIGPELRVERAEESALRDSDGRDQHKTERAWPEVIPLNRSRWRGDNISPPGAARQGLEVRTCSIHQAAHPLYLTSSASVVDRQVRLGRGAPGSAGQDHVLRVFLHPTYTALRTLASATDHAVDAWGSGQWPSRLDRQNATMDISGNGIGRNDVDLALALAMARVLRTAKYAIEVPPRD